MGNKNKCFGSFNYIANLIFRNHLNYNFTVTILKMTDYDKKFEEDLERAQALSLESLALEQFKNKRLQELSKNSSNGQSKKAPSGNKIIIFMYQ